MKTGDMFRAQGIKTLHGEIGSTQIINSIPWNTIGIILQVQNSWLHIITPTGKTGWCSNLYIKVVQ
jgi:hypothetical protein